MGDLIQFHDDKILFDTDKIAFDPACCCVVTCENCDNDPIVTTPLQYQLTFSGIGDAGDCADCSPLNDTFIVGQYAFGSPLGCHWRHYFDPAVCDLDRATIDIIKAGANTTVEVYVRRTAVAVAIRWEKTITGQPIDCGFSGLDIPYVGNNTNRCDATASTCTLTAL